MTDKIKLILVEDHELTRKGILYGLNKNPVLEIVGEAIDGYEAVNLFKEKQPDLVLMDLGLPIIDGIEATKKIKELNKDAKIIILTSQSEQEKVFAAFEAGASAYCMKDIKLDSLNKIIDIVMDGGVWIDPQVANFILDLLPVISKQVNKNNNKPSKALGDCDLTSREREILELVALGYNNKDIANELTLSIHTVKNHVSNIITKLAVDDRTQAAIMAIKEGLI